MSRVKPTWGTAVLLLGLFLTVKLWLVAGVELGKDEAAYWYWSQRLDASYALLPFGVIRLAHELAPGREWVLRLGPLWLGLAGVLLLYRLCRLHDLAPVRSVWASAAFATSLWSWHATSFLHPDGFLVTCWLLALVWARQSEADATPASHARLGLAAGLAVLCKYSGAFLVVGLFAWILLTRTRGVRLRSLLWALVPFLVVTSPLIHAQLATWFHLPYTLGTLSQVAESHSVLTRLALFPLGPLLFVSPLLLWLLYRVLWRRLRDWRRLDRDQLLGLLPALCLLAGFALFALARGQIKGNWLLPGFLGLWPAAFSRANLPSRATLFLLLLLLAGLLQALPIGLFLKYPAAVGRLAAAPQARILDTTYGSLVSRSDRSREATHSWTERACEYSGWQELADELAQTLALRGITPAVPLVSPQYGVTFGMLYYGAGDRTWYTVDDPRFADLTDFHQLAGPPYPPRVLFLARRGTPVPPSLRDLCPNQQPLATLTRTGAGCPPIHYQLLALSR